MSNKGNACVKAIGKYVLVILDLSNLLLGLYNIIAFVILIPLLIIQMVLEYYFTGHLELVVSMHENITDSLDKILLVYVATPAIIFGNYFYCYKRGFTAMLREWFQSLSTREKLSEAYSFCLCFVFSCFVLLGPIGIMLLYWNWDSFDIKTRHAGIFVGAVVFILALSSGGRGTESATTTKTIDPGIDVTSRGGLPYQSMDD